MKMTFAFLLAFSFSLTLALAQVPAGQEADAVFEEVHHEWVLNPSGGVEYQFDQRTKLLSHFSFDRAYGETFILYNPQWQTLKIRKAFTIMANGSEVQSPSNAFNEVLPGFAAGCAPYLHLREMVVTHTGIQKGAAINLGYTITTKDGFGPGLIGKVVLGDRSPIHNLTASWSVPRGTPLVVALRLPDGAVQVLGLSLRDGISMPVPLPKGSATLIMTTKGDKVEYRFTAKDLPLVPVASGQPPLDQCVPTLFFSSVTEKVLRTHVVGEPSSRFALSDRSRAALSRLFGKETSAAGKFAILRGYVESNVASMSGDPGLTGYRAMSAEDVFSRSSGSGLDKAVLLTALCRAAGVDASLVLGRLACPDYTGEVILPTGSAWCAANVNGWMLLDALHAQPRANASMDFCETPIILDGVKPSLPASTLSSLNSRISIMVAPDLTITGTANVAASPAFAEPDRMTAQFRKSLEAVALGAKVRDSLIRTSAEPFLVRLSLLRGTPMPINHGVVKMPMPVLPGSIASSHPVLAALPRTTPWRIQCVDEEIQEITLQLPQGVSLFPPETRKLKNAAGSVEFVIERQGKTIVVRRSLKLTSRRIQANEYEAMRELLALWLDPAWSALTFSVPTSMSGK